ncbi:hypothetical protein A5787_08165 [Mycobacterium sp. 852002-50816_SCH5313054-b]|uniref:hypothetical protein n=1 Tax=Mycobacterium sp. 852002-50816_SCH5313054-b TaxID=1834092 RepID=UPI000800CAF0|nr:hypothetical protein [Mycobacterium sp. 852002-50816_SCH5313054-b]OBF50249.1 hypothetical protein A5787_08165 [Mycobacterium sp. 852002-50816_SCH5313054-b]
MNADDAEKRIADLERQLAEQKRIAELERQLAEARAAAGQDADSDDRARQYAQSLWEGLRSGGPVGPGGPSAPEMAQHREAFMQAAARAGLSQDQIDNIFKHGRATFKVGHSVVYSGQGAIPDDGAGAGIRQPPGFPQQVGSKRHVTRGRRRPWGMRGWPDRIGAIIGALGICIGAAASLTATMPASAMWTSPFVCDSGYQLAYNTTNYSYQPGQSGTSVSFECVGATGSYEPSWIAIDALQTILATVVLGAAVGLGFLIWRSFRRQS